MALRHLATLRGLRALSSRALAGVFVGSTSHVRGPTSPALLERTIGEHFDHIVSQHGDRLALAVRHQHVRWSYEQLSAQVERLASSFLEAGLRKGDAVAICAANCAEWIVVQYATAKIGLVLVNINPAYRPREMCHALTTIGVVALILQPQFRSNNFIAMFNEMLPELASHAPNTTGRINAAAVPSLRAIYLLGQEPAPRGMMLFDELMMQSSSASHTGISRVRAAQAHTHQHDVVNVQFTSGTTGLPKGAALTHRNILNNGFMVGWTLRYTPADRVCLCVPMYHCFGMVMASLAAMSHGAASVMPSDWFDPRAALVAVQAERCTSLYGVPTMFIAELELPDLGSFDLTSLRTGIMAGSICPAELMAKVVHQLHIPQMTVCYGMTETSPVSFQTHVDDPFERRVGTVGHIHPHVEVRIADPSTGATVPVGSAGELLTRGYSVMKGYWGDEKRTAEAIDPNGWMRTGDMAVLDPDGCARIVGRYKDMVIRGGENVYPSEVEELLYTHPDISDVQVVGVPDARFGEELCACIIPHHNKAAPSTAAVHAFCRGRIAPFKIPRYILVFDAFPLTVTGKIQKYLLREESARRLGLA
eukprot:m.53397 g.53397  ORF g.53397 m.53397 type:complete len:591 (-) comp11826_c0_seq2:29-1801(-)